jgi:hypothetical protein
MTAGQHTVNDMRSSDDILSEMDSVIRQGKELFREYQRLEQIFERLKTELDDAKRAELSPTFPML